MTVRPVDPIAFRPAAQGDAALVRRAHVAHRTELLAGIDWPAGALVQLCEQQHAWQEDDLNRRHPAAERRMILAGGVEIGRLCLDRTTLPWRIVDLVLVPEAQSRGRGTAALRAVLDEAARAGAAVDLHVGRDNPRAAALYNRLGFVPVDGGSESHARMLWPEP